jgi:hypothetical protein
MNALRKGGRLRLSVAALAACSALSFFACRPAVVAPAGQGAVGLPVVGEPTADPANGYFAVELGSPSAALAEIVYPPWPFADRLVVGPASIDWQGGAGDGGRSARIFGPAEAGETLGEAPAVAAAAGAGAFSVETAEAGYARRGDVEYRLDGGRISAGLVAPSGAETALVAAARISGGRRSAAASAPLVVGPLVFADFVVAVSSAPALVFFDRSSLALTAELPLGRACRDRLAYVAEPGLLALLHADGSVGLYRLGGTAPAAADDADPVAAWLEPLPAAAAAIKEKTASLLGGRSDISFGPAAPYTAAAAVDPASPSLFRFTTGASGRYRCFVADAADVPYLVALFDLSGQLVASNIEYTGAEAVLEQELVGGAGYFLVAAYFDVQDAPGRLVLSAP